MLLLPLLQPQRLRSSQKVEKKKPAIAGACLDRICAGRSDDGSSFVVLKEGEFGFRRYGLGFGVLGLCVYYRLTQVPTVDSKGLIAGSGFRV